VKRRGGGESRSKYFACCFLFRFNLLTRYVFGGSSNHLHIAIPFIIYWEIILIILLFHYYVSIIFEKEFYSKLSLRTSNPFY
jgi:hypothetical protein